MPISAPQYDPNERAQQQAAIRYGAAEAQLNRSLEANRMMEAAQRAALDQYGQAGRGVITDTFNQLHGNLEANRADTANQLGTQVGLVGQGYRDAQALGDQARSDSSERLARLAGTIGLSGAGLADVSTGVEQLAARQLAASAQDDATRTGNLQTWAAQQDAFLRQGQAMAQREGADRASSFENELVRALAELQAAARNQEYDIHGNLLDLTNERGAFTVEQANALMDQLFGQNLQAANYNLSEQEAISAAAARAAAQDMDARRLAMAEQEFASSQKGNSLKDFLALSQEDREAKMFGLDYALKQSQLGKMPDPRTIDEWAKQQGVSSSDIDLLMQKYNEVIQDVLTANQFAQGNIDLPESEASKYSRLAGTTPEIEFMRRWPAGFFVPKGPGSPQRNVLSSAQLREILPFLE